MAKIFKALIFLLVFCLCAQKIYAAGFENYSINEYQEVPEENNFPAPDPVTLNADRVSFNDETGHATAEGNAILRYQDTTVRAERIDYDSDTQKIQAMPLPGEKVILTSGNRSVRGDRLDYDLNSREGILAGAVTRLAVGEDNGILYVYGNEIDVIPWELAKERGLVNGSYEEYVVQWNNVVLTTCNLDHPHYRLESKNISFVPGRSVTAKKPRIYLGNTYLFTYPFDYFVTLDRRAIRYSFFPYIQHSDTKGSGGGVTGTIGWDTGSASLGFAYAGKAGFEFMVAVEQQLNSDFSILVGVEHSWDDLWNERVWRPQASLMYSHNGWDAALTWKKNEYITDQKNTLDEYKGRLERRPEFIVWGPWFNPSENSWLRINANYGSYRETMYGESESDVISRYGLGFWYYYEKPLNKAGTLEYFADSRGVAWFYDHDDSDHEMLRSFSGLRYKIGSVELGTAYESQYTWGESAMHWDQFSDRKRIHQKIRFPLGREIYASFRGSYDFDESMVDEIHYSLQWVTDCMTWDLHYKHDRTSGSDDQLGLTLSLQAFPDRSASFGQNINIDPFERPREIPKKK